MRVLSVLLALWASACAVGPDYRAPDLVLPVAFGADRNPSGAVADGALDAWWGEFGDAGLVRAIETALDSNRDLRIAAARVEEARALRSAAAAGLGPQVAMASEVARRRESENTNLGRIIRGVGAPLTQNAYALGADASWELDLFGGNRRAREAAGARLEAIEQQWRAVRLAVAAEVARAWFEREGADRLMATIAEQLALQEQSLRAIDSKVRGGLARPVDLDLARAQLESTRAQLPRLRAARAEQHHRLGVLLGGLPVDAPEPTATGEAEPRSALPPVIPLGIPFGTVRRRPDVRAAERKLHAATADIGVATAELYPKLFALGSGGLASLTSGDWLEAASRTWLLGAGVRWRIFESGGVRAGIRGREAAQRAALAAFEQAVLRALEDVESTAVAFDQEREAAAVLGRATAAAQAAAVRARSLYDAGLADVLTVLTADRQANDAQRAWIEAQTRARAFAVGLYQALGGGWSDLPEAGV